MRLHDIQVSISALNEADKIQVAQQAQLQAAAAQQMLHLKKEELNREHSVNAPDEEKAMTGLNERTPHSRADAGNKDKHRKHEMPDTVKAKRESENTQEQSTKLSQNHIIDIKA